MRPASALSKDENKMRKSQVFEARDNNKNVRDVKDERDYGEAKLINHSGNSHTVMMRWNLFNKHCREDQIFELQIGDKVARLNWEEILRYGRWI